MSPTDSLDRLRERVMGCWLGKAVGGTLGQSFEGLEGPLDATFYDPVPESMVPNDDLDLPVLWAWVMDREDPVRVDRHLLARAWQEHVEFPWNEYGVAQRNLADGIAAPASGAYDNWYTCGEGAAIRAEIWACLAAGDPELAAAYAYEDACVDHAGDGIWAAVFNATLQSAAFSESDPDRLLDRAQSALPVSSRVRQAIEDTRRWVAEGLHWNTVRERILERYGVEDMTDVRMNNAFVVLGWLAGRDYAERILICNNCGKDTDSSTASLGSLLGILDPSSIPDDWLAPIGRELVLSKEIVGITPPATLEEFTDLVLSLRERLGGRPPEPSEPSASQTATSGARGLPIDIAFTNDYAAHKHSRSRFMPAAGGPALKRTGDERHVVLNGTWHRMPREEFSGDVAILRYAFTLQEERHVRVMFNTTEQCRVWVDDAYVFGRETGGLGEPAAMKPALHGPPLNQFADITLDAGRHEITAAVRRPTLPREAEWVIAVADPATGMWLPGVFLDPAQTAR